MGAGVLLLRAMDRPYRADPVYKKRRTTASSPNNITGIDRGEAAARRIMTIITEIFASHRQQGGLYGLKDEYRQALVH
jgi:hypothetical protein